MGKFTEQEIQKGLDEGYKKAGHNAYFGRGFEAGIAFATQRQSLPIDVSNSDDEPLGVKLTVERGNKHPTIEVFNRGVLMASGWLVNKTD